MHIERYSYASININGVSEAVRGTDRLGPWTTWASRVLYQSYDVTALVKSGATNAVGVTLGNGQYDRNFHILPILH
jgi:hypothetical protein